MALHSEEALFNTDASTTETLILSNEELAALLATAANPQVESTIHNTMAERRRAVLLSTVVPAEQAGKILGRATDQDYDSRLNARSAAKDTGKF